MSSSGRKKRPTFKRKAGTAKSKRLRAKTVKARALEDQVVSLARSGAFASVTRAAIERQFERGATVVVKRGDEVVRWYPNGHVERILDIEPKAYRLPRGVKVLRPTRAGNGTKR